jgi:hypothetical protein
MPLALNQNLSSVYAPWDWDSDLFQTPNCFSAVAVLLRQYNRQFHKSHTQYTYHLHTNTYDTINITRKQTNYLTKLQKNWRTYYSQWRERRKKIKIELSLIQALESYWVVRHRDPHIVCIIDLYLAVMLFAGRVLPPRIILRNIFS